MLNSTTAIASSGLQAAQKRLQVSADNTANMHSTQSRAANGEVINAPYAPKRVAQSSLAEGGVSASVRPQEAATVTLPNAEGVPTEYPNVNLEQEVIEQQFATYDFKANLKSLEAADGMHRQLLDILS
jgi:flagellar basal-body rod protein FlgC